MKGRPKRREAKPPAGVKWIARRTLRLVDPDSGATTSVIVEIGLPAPVPDSEAFGCAVRIGGLIGDVGPIQGVDSLQAVEEACRFVRRYLAQCKQAPNLRWPTGDPYDDGESMVWRGSGCAVAMRVEHGSRGAATAIAQGQRCVTLSARGSALRAPRAADRRRTSIRSEERPPRSAFATTVGVALFATHHAIASRRRWGRTKRAPARGERHRRRPQSQSAPTGGRGGATAVTPPSQTASPAGRGGVERVGARPARAAVRDENPPRKGQRQQSRRGSGA